MSIDTLTAVSDPQKRAPTLADVAAAAGCSTAVVSCVVNGARGKVSVRPATRARVLATAANLGYRPHFASRSLARRRSETLGVFVEPSQWAGLGYDYEGSILQGVESVCRTRNYDILAINLGGNQTPESCEHKFVEQRIDGLLLLHVQTHAAWVERLCSLHHNVAAVNYYGPCRNLDVLNFDNVEAGRLASRHLAELGHRRVGYMGSMDSATGPGTTERCEGLLREAAELGLECRPEWVLDPPNTAFMAEIDALPYASRFTAAAARIADFGPRGPTAWLAYCDVIAVRIGQRLRRLGVRVPDDLSLIGIDDAQSAESFDPPLSTVKQPFAAMGAQAAELLIQRAEQGLSDCPHSLTLCPPSLVVRESTAPVSRQHVAGSRRKPMESTGIDRNRAAQASHAGCSLARSS